MLVVAVLSLTGITYAWFTSGTTATVSGMKVEVAVADGGVQSVPDPRNADFYAVRISDGDL